MRKKINVLYVCHERGGVGGAALSLLNLISAVRDEVEPIVLLDDRGSGDVRRFFSERGLECLSVPFDWCARKKGNAVSYAIKLLPRLVKSACVNRLCVRRVCSLLRGRDIDIVHTNGSVTDVGYHVAKRMGARHVWHIREFQNLDFDLRPLRGWERLKGMIYESDAAVAISRAVYDHWGLDKARNPHCIRDAVRPSGEAECVFPKEKYFLFCAAWLNDAKGAGFAVEAFAESGLWKSGYKLVLVGKCRPKYRAFLDGLLSKLHLEGKVLFAGYREDVRDYFVHATAFLMCSQNEGLGRVTVEAMFYGCPVVARRSGGTTEFISHGRNGLLFDDKTGCARCMRAVATEDMSEMAGNALRTACRDFSEEAYGERMAAIYWKIINP